MTSPSRSSSRACALALATLLALALGACGKDSDDRFGLPATPAPATVTSTATSTATPTPEATETPTAEPTGHATPSSPDAQVVEVAKYGIAFELPKGWITLDAKKVLESGGKNPFLDELAERLGTPREQLVKAFSTAVVTMSVSDEGAHHGFLDNVNTTGQVGDVNDEQLKLQLATIGAKPGAIDHATTEVGDVTVVHYALSSGAGLTIRAVALAVRTGDDTVAITVSSSTDARATKIADQVQASLRKIPGTGPNL